MHLLLSSLQPIAAHLCYNTCTKVTDNIVHVQLLTDHQLVSSMA